MGSPYRDKKVVGVFVRFSALATSEASGRAGAAAAAAGIRGWQHVSNGEQFAEHR
jgi:hypothetical protein